MHVVVLFQHEFEGFNFFAVRLMIFLNSVNHGLRTPNEGINQIYLKNWADVETKYASVVPKNLGLGLNFRPCSEGYFLSGRP